MNHRILLASALLLALAPTPAGAHPHAWIDYRVTAVMDDQNKLVALKEHWLFDEYYTEFALHDFAKDKKNEKTSAILLELAKDNLENLKPYDYFSVLELDGKKVAAKGVSDIASELVNGHIAMDFTLQFAAPIDPKGHKLSYRIYDPTYYISMLHDKSNGFVFQGSKTSACTNSLKTPNPSVAEVDFAASVDKNGKMPDDYGHFFAQRMMIECK